MSEELEDIYQDVIQEMKRIDHIIFVTLKYTRTVDVLKSIIARMIAAFDFMLDLILESYRENGDIDSYPNSPGLKVDQIRKLTQDDKIAELLDFYLMLRRASRSEYEVINEYKRHVGMVMQKSDGSELIINIDKVTEFYHTMQGYMEYLRKFVFNE
ncbi:MAG: hypothetical protein ACLFSL_02745 [Candidatus Woesearchaeota archaeon]